MKKKSSLEDLPTVIVENTFWWKIYRDTDGKVIERHHVTRVAADWVSQKITYFWWGLKGKIASKLLTGFADPCPYCNKWIKKDTWEKITDEP